MSIGPLLRNLPLAAHTALAHLGEDPVVLALQAARRLPPGLVQPAAAFSARAARQPVAAALGMSIRGDADAARLVLEQAAHAGAGGARSPRQLVRLSDVAVAANLPGHAARLLADVPVQTRGRRAAEARLHWHRGDMDDAVAVLAGGTRQERRLRQALAAERRVFAGWAPELEAVPGYRPRPDTVLHLLTNSLPHTGSGYAQRSHSLLQAQAEAGWSVHAATRLGYPVTVGRLSARRSERVDAVTYHRLLAASPPPGLDARLQLQAELFLDLARRLRPVALHATTPFSNALVVRAVAASLGIPWAYEVRGQLADTWASARGPQARRSRRYLCHRQREADAAASADLVLTLGSEMAAGLARDGVPAGRVVLLPNAVGGPFLDEPQDSGAVRTALGLGPGELIGSVTSVVDYEGLDDLLRAMALLVPRRPRLRCLIAGDGAALPGLRILARRLGVEASVIFAGRVPRAAAPRYHQALDIFVLPRKDLAVTRAVTPLKPVEALASARPVVASDLPALREIVRHEHTGLLVPAADPRALAEALERLLADPAARDRMGREGRAEVLATRTWQANASLTLKGYRRLAAEAVR